MKQNKLVSIIIFLLIIFLVLLLLKHILNLVFPIKYSEYVEKYSEECNIDKNLIYAVIKQESNFKNDVNSNKGAKGLMQLIDSTGIHLATQLGYDEHDLYDPETNIEFGTKYLAYLIGKYKNDKIALAAYNAGEGNVDTWINQGIIESDGSNLQNIPFKETNMYVRRVLINYEIYSKLY